MTSVAFPGNLVMMARAQKEIPCNSRSPSAVLIYGPFGYLTERQTNTAKCISPL